jgi:hypothetical protein
MQKQQRLLLSVLLVSNASSVLSAPFLQEVTDFFAGIRYVPPAGGGLFAPTNNPPSPDGYAAPAADSPDYSSVPKAGSSEYEGPVLIAPSGNLFQPSHNPPVPEEAAYSAPKGTDYPSASVESYGAPDSSSNEGSSWIGGSNVDYLVGERDMNRYDAAAWCAAQGGRLAELPSVESQRVVTSILLLKAAGGINHYNNYWLGLQRPFLNWDHSAGRTAAYSDWAGDYLGQQNNDCAFLNGQFLHWEAGDCGKRGGYRALCERDRPGSAVKTPREEKEEVGDSLASGEHCTVPGVRIVLDNWLTRLERINSTAECHAACLGATRCNFWTWNRVSRRCYMKEADGPVVKDETSESGTTLRTKGCQQELKTTENNSKRGSRIEYCSCAASTDLSYLNPRSLPADGGAESEQLGRLIRYTACPFGQELVCTDDDTKKPAAAVEAKAPPVSNITDCIVYDMKLSGDEGDAVLGRLRQVADAETCAAACLSATGCTYWTWRGDLPARTCLLLAAETAAQRRPGTASGTVRKELGCLLKIVSIQTQQQQQLKEQQQQYREDDDCTCELDPNNVLLYARSAILEEDNTAETEATSAVTTEAAGTEEEGSGTEEPAPPQGRIVNLELLESKSGGDDEETCPSGYVRVCAEKRQVVQEWKHPLLPLQAPYTGVEARIGGQEEDNEHASRAVRFPTD